MRQSELIPVVPQPESLPRSSHWRIRSPQGEVSLIATRECAFAVLQTDGPGWVELIASQPLSNVTLRPQRLKLPVEVEGNRLRIEVPGPQHLCIEAEGLPVCFLYIGIPESAPAAPGPGGTLIRIPAGSVREVDCLELHSGDVLHLEAGSVLRGGIHARGAENLRISGQGIVDGSSALREGRKQNLLLLEDCRGVEIEGLTLIQPSTWMLVLAGCRDVRIRDLREIGEVMCSDGIDVVASRGVRIEGCCLRNNDDCVVIKSKPGPGRKLVEPETDCWLGDVEEVRVRDCLLWNAACGNAMEIGFELNTAAVRDVVFEEIDVLGAHGHGGVFTIHNGDQATVENVTYRHIRVEHFWDRLVDFGIYSSRYSTSDLRGRIRNIRFEHIRAVEDRYNTISLMGGHDAAHGVEGVHFHDFRIGEQTVETPAQLNLYTNAFVRNLRFSR